MPDFVVLLCARYDPLSVVRLPRKHTPDTPLPTIVRAQICDCPNWNAQQERERYDLYSPTLLPLFAGLEAEVDMFSLL